MLNSEEQEQDDEGGAHFAEQVYEGHQQSLVVVEKELAAVLVPQAVPVHPILQEVHILFRHDHSPVLVLVLPHFLQPPEQEPFAEVQHQSCGEYGGLEVVDGESHQDSPCHRLQGVLPGEQVQSQVVEVDERVQPLREVVNQQA